MEGPLIWKWKDPSKFYYHLYLLRVVCNGGFKNISIYLTCRVTHKGREKVKVGRETFSDCWFTSQMANGWGWSGLKPGTQNSMWVSKVSGRAPNTSIIFHCFPGTSPGNWIGKSSLDSNLGLAANIASSSLTWYVTTSVFFHSFSLFPLKIGL